MSVMPWARKHLYWSLSSMRGGVVKALSPKWDKRAGAIRIKKAWQGAWKLCVAIPRAQ